MSVLRSKVINSVFMLPHFIIRDPSSLWDLIWELNVIKGSRCTTFTDRPTLVLVVTINWKILGSRMHNDRLLSRWGWEVSLLLRRAIHISNFIVSIEGIGVLNDSCTWFPRLQWLRHSLQSETLIVLWLAIATLVRQLVTVWDKLRAATRWIRLSSS